MQKKSQGDTHQGESLFDRGARAAIESEEGVKC
jgi:hypothetical protein